MDSFLLIGQSNMAGRGKIEDVDPIYCSKIKVLRMGRWTPFATPVNFDNVTAGISLAESFAFEYVKKYDREVGLIPCAKGDTNIDMWSKGQALFDNAVFQTKLAMRTSELKGILWHQGEADCGTHDEHYGKLIKFINDIRCEIGQGNVPFLIGGLGEYLKDFPQKNYQLFKEFNDCLQRVADACENAGYVSSKGLTPNEDILHFNAVSLREFGVRYFNELVSIIEK